MEAILSAEEQGLFGPKSGTPRGRILVFGEDAPTRESLAHALESEQYEVVRATNCQEAIKHFAAPSTALVLIDDPGGSQPIAAVGASWFARLNRDVPLVILTVSPEFRKLHVRSDLAAVLEKPVPIPLLLATMRQLLEQAEASRRERRAIQLRQRIAVYGGF